MLYFNSVANVNLVFNLGNQVGRIPGDWARSLIPLVNSGQVRVGGKCRSAPAVLSLMSSIIVDFK